MSAFACQSRTQTQAVYRDGSPQAPHDSSSSSDSVAEYGLPNSQNVKFEGQKAPQAAPHAAETTGWGT